MENFIYDRSRVRCIWTYFENWIPTCKPKEGIRQKLILVPVVKEKIQSKVLLLIFVILVRYLENLFSIYFEVTTLCKWME